MSPKTHVFLIDATNLVRQAYGYGGEAFRAQEESDARHLVAALSELCLRRGSLVEVDLVFDGDFRPMAAQTPANLRVRFSPGMGADAAILDRTRALRHGGSRVTVVTGDSELARAAREEGGRILFPRSGGLEGIVAAIEGRLR